MSENLSKRERVEAALHGEAVDRVPVSAWRHFIPEENRPDLLAQASLRYFREYDWDWLKVNPRATYTAEAWGNRYDYRSYDRVYPKLKSGPLESPADLEKIQEVNPTDGTFGEQLNLIRQVKAGINNAHFLQTVFSPLSVLAFLIGHPKQHSADAVLQSQVLGIKRGLRENPQGMHAALQAITTTLSRYAEAVVETGASGLFFAIVKLARQGVLSQAEYEEFGKPYDLQVLQAVQGAPFNLLHICGPAVYFDSVADYPVHALNWAAVGQRNPTVGEALQRTQLAIVGGVDEDGALQDGLPDDVLREAGAAIQATRGRNFLLSPGCATNMYAPSANLHALRQAADRPLEER
jgi:uroporphyrinogen decarboxylase